jgi:hypothetical protein
MHPGRNAELQKLEVYRAKNEITYTHTHTHSLVRTRRSHGESQSLIMNRILFAGTVSIICTFATQTILSVLTDLYRPITVIFLSTLGRSSPIKLY